MKKYTYLILFVAVLVIGCKKDPDPSGPNDTGKIEFVFLHYVDGDTIQIDTMKYQNEAGNHYLITEVQYFISDVILHNSDGSTLLIDDWKDIHYVDNDIPSTLTWEVFDEIPSGVYNSISFTFGIKEEKNFSLMYVNPPERDMFWPDVLGGGYHYLKLNGKWENTGMVQNRPFEFHLGIGQIYSGDSIYIPDITGFVHNDFNVNLPNSGFTIERGETLEILLEMNIESWFKNPNMIDLGTFPENIMQCQTCIEQGCENGTQDVFNVQDIKVKDCGCGI